ncbi:MAG TPA: ATP-binding cassette domain-containing protein [Desulfobacteraceae bacterium]|nr:ATP-binding cassette domain-containing protein [Desulfobacteraceae bacterium]
MISLSELCIDLPGFSLKNINLGVEEKDFFVIIGPTGSGKSLILEAVTGLIPVNSGSVFIENTDVTDLPTELRGVGIVYQDFALFPHLNVQKNSLYGVRYHNIPEKEIKDRFSLLVNCMDLTRILLRHPMTLSGGEKQRVALARALILNPRVLLLDEPLSALDPMLQDDLKRLLKQLHKELGATFVMVSHNFSDVLFLANKGAIINKGRIIQTGTVTDLFEKPSSPFAAEFVGMKNVFSIKAMASGVVTIPGRKGDLELKTGIKGESGAADDFSWLALRPEDILLSRKGGAPNTFEGRVTGLVAREFYHDVFVDVSGVAFVVRCSRQKIVKKSIKPDTKLCISLPAASMHFF